VLGNDVTVKNGTSVWDGVTIEDGGFIGPAVVFTNDSLPRSPRLPEASERYSSVTSTRVCRGAALGGGAVVLPGVTVGEFSLVGAGLVVTRDIPPYKLVVGNPARAVGWICACGNHLALRAKRALCTYCALKYKKSQEGVTQTEALRPPSSS
jgi:UDP-2-acetamido-3-amino-2,3-dideoxy-glucuronate N-acetyltransferase